VKVSFKRRKIAKVFMTHVQFFFRKSLSKATFERKLSSVSLALHQLGVPRSKDKNNIMTTYKDYLSVDGDADAAVEARI